MEVNCPQCNKRGFLKVRGNSYRIKHHKGFINGTRKYTIHSLSQEDVIKMGIIIPGLIA